VEGSFPFITFSDAYKVISVSEVNFCVESGFLGSVQKIGNQWEWITIFPGDPVDDTWLGNSNKTTNMSFT
jgi:hypothetical protein